MLHQAATAHRLHLQVVGLNLGIAASWTYLTRVFFVIYVHTSPAEILSRDFCLLVFAMGLYSFDSRPICLMTLSMSCHKLRLLAAFARSFFCQSGP